MRVDIPIDLTDIFSSHSKLFDIFLSRKNSTAKLLNFCVGCNRVRMAAVPQAAFAARKVRLNAYLAESWQRHLNLDQEAADTEFEHVHSSASFMKVDQSTMEQPMKYSSKLMNSIWGLYNRYSVHNLKKITDGKEILVGEHQLQAAVSHSSLDRFFAACQNN